METMEMRLVKAYVLVTALSPSAAFASTTLNALAIKIILTAIFAAVRHIHDEILCLLNCQRKVTSKYCARD